MTSVPVGTSITFGYSVPSAGVTSTNWVGIYQAGQTPGDVGSTTYQYTPDASGTVTFATSSLSPGSYVAYYLYDDGYEVLAGPVGFTVTGASPYAGGTLTSTVTSVPNAQSITFSYSVPTAGVTSTNWVGIYEPGQTPGAEASTTYQYAPDASGTVTFSTSSLDGVGKYVAYFFYDNGYQIIAGPVSFSVTPGTLAPAPVYQRAIGAHQLRRPASASPPPERRHLGDRHRPQPGHRVRRCRPAAAHDRGRSRTSTSRKASRSTPPAMSGSPTPATTASSSCLPRAAADQLRRQGQRQRPA